MKQDFIKFYVENFNFLNSAEDINLSFLSPIVRRRLSKIDKTVFYILNESLTENTENIIFSSKTGEQERLLKIIDQYTSLNEVSPNTFSGSVHNYPVGFFLMNKKISIPYNAVSSCDNSLSSGFISSVVSKYNTLYCYAEIGDNNINAFGILINKKDTDNLPSFGLYVENNDKTNDSYENYIKLFKGDIGNIFAKNFSVKRIQNEK